VLERDQTREARERCTVATLFSAYRGSLTLQAETAIGRLGHAKVESPKDVASMAIFLPATILADVATAPISIGLLLLNSPDAVRDVLEQVQTTDSGEQGPEQGEYVPSAD
jgi:hypothetical protein